MGAHGAGGRRRPGRGGRVGGRSPRKEAMLLTLVSSRWVTSGACRNFRLVSLQMRRGAGGRRGSR